MPMGSVTFESRKQLPDSVFVIIIAAAVFIVLVIQISSTGKHFDRIEKMVQDLRNDTPIVELNILADLPQYQADVDLCNAHGATFVGELRTLKARVQDMYNDISELDGRLTKGGH